jgi:hypothetical protein
VKTLRSKIEVAKSDIQSFPRSFSFHNRKPVEETPSYEPSYCSKSILPKNSVPFADPRPDTPHPNSHNSAMLLKINFFTKHVTPITLFLYP